MTLLVGKLFVTVIAVGLKDITAHVNFSGIALAGQSAGLEVIGYTSQARFLMNCGLLDLVRCEAGIEQAGAVAGLPVRQRDVAGVVGRQRQRDA